MRLRPGLTDRALIGSVAYPDLRDHSAGLVVVERLLEGETPASVVVEDLSFNPIAVVQRLQDEPPGDFFVRAIFLGSVPREGLRLPGAITAYRWDGELPDAEEIQRAVTDGVTGIIHLDNTLIVARHFGMLPVETYVIEIEPWDHDFGSELSGPVAAAIEPASQMAMRLATDPAYARSLPVAPLGGDAVVSVGGW